MYICLYQNRASAACLGSDRLCLSLDLVPVTIPAMVMSESQPVEMDRICPSDAGIDHSELQAPLCSSPGQGRFLIVSKQVIQGYQPWII